MSAVPTGQACAVLQPAVAEAARRAGVAVVGLVDVGPVDVAAGVRPWAALDLRLDELATVWSDGTVTGDTRSEVRLTCRLAGGRDLPPTPVPRVAVRVGPVDRPSPAALIAALDEVPADVLPVVLTAWTLSRLRRDARAALVDALAGAGRRCAWVSVEGVGVAPGVPTLGDRPASGHSLVAVALLDGAGGSVRPEVVARCWSRGQVLAWLAEPPEPPEPSGLAS